MVKISRCKILNENFGQLCSPKIFFKNLGRKSRSKIFVKNFCRKSRSQIFVKNLSRKSRSKIFVKNLGRKSRSKISVEKIRQKSWSKHFGRIFWLNFRLRISVEDSEGVEFGAHRSKVSDGGTFRKIALVRSGLPLNARFHSEDSECLPPGKTAV